jgi:hypothetical protein
MTPLDKPLKRALNINGRDYVVTIDPQALKITEKGRRLGLELKWADVVSGETALAVALHASLGNFNNAPKAASRDSKATPKSKAGPSRVPALTAPPKSAPPSEAETRSKTAVPTRQVLSGSHGIDQVNSGYCGWSRPNADLRHYDLPAPKQPITA